MRIEQFEAIIETAKYKSMQKAAESLYTSAQNISKLIKDFESELHVTLFVRNRHGVFLTADGEYIVSELEAVMQKLKMLQYHYAENNMDFFSSYDEKIDMLRILSAPTESDFVTTLLNYINKRYTTDTVLFNIQDAIIINQMLESSSNKIFNDYDLVFANVLDSNLDNLKDTYPSGTLHLLYKNPLGIHISKNNPLASKSSISVKDLYNQDLIAYLPDGQDTTIQLRALKNIGCILNPKFIIKSEKACLNLIQKNMGYSVLHYSDYINKNMDESTIIIPLKEKVYIHHVLLVNPACASETYYPHIQNYISKHFKYTQQLY